MLEMRSAATGVGDDGVEAFRWKPVNLFARQVLRQFPLPVMRVQRSAAELFGGSNDLAAVARQHFHRIAIHIAKNEVLGTTREHGHPETSLACGRSDEWDQFRGEVGLDLRGYRFQLAQAPGQKPQDTAAPDQGLQSELLVQPQQSAERLQTIEA